MNDFLNLYQNLPTHIDPIALRLGPFSVGWYSLMYLAGFLAVYFLLLYRIRSEEFKASTKDLNETQLRSIVLDFLFYVFIGLLIGARSGYVLFYDFSFFWNNPIAIFSPYDSISHEFVGIYGMSFHGGLLGVLAASYFFLKKYGVGFWRWADFIVPTIPAGYFFGRIGNFLNGELYGRITGKFWGMYFLDENGRTFILLRHPSQLYEALAEGLLLFLILWPIRNQPYLKRKMLALYLIGYSIARIGVEFFREPDEQIGFILGFLTLGQLLSALMLLAGLAIFFLQKSTPPHQDKAMGKL